MIYVLNIVEKRGVIQWLCFDSIESGREFLKLLPGYHYTVGEVCDEIETEWLDTLAFPDYDEIDFRGCKVPISKFMFRDWGMVTIYFSEISNLCFPCQGLIEGATRIDAYSIPNEEVQDYIEKREKAFLRVKKILNENQREVKRGYYGSEDGEAILFKQPSEDDWHFLEHLDPSFVTFCEEEEQKVRSWVEESLKQSK